MERIKYQLHKAGDKYAPMVGQYVGAMVSFYDYKYLKGFRFGCTDADIVVIETNEPQFMKLEIAKQICEVHKVQKFEFVEL